MAVSIEIKDAPALEKWLGEQSHATCSVIAARVAIRTLPLILQDFEGTSEQSRSGDKRRIILEAHRANFISWASNVYADAIPRSVMVELAAATLPKEFQADVPDALLAAWAALATAATDESAKADVRNVYFAERGVVPLAMRAATAAASAVPNSDLIWKSITEDIQWTTRHGEGEKLIGQPLWLADVRDRKEYNVNFPAWARRSFDKFDESGLVKRGPWGVWLAWYRGILSNLKSSSARSRFGSEIGGIL